MKILLLGASGQVGHELHRTLAPLGDVLAAARQGFDHRADLADLAGLEGLLQQTSPDLIVNAAAYTAVDRAEQETELARRINGEAVAVLGQYARKNDAAVVHYSTDYVFDGTSQRPYREDDPVDPINAYGASKLAGERALSDSGCRHLIFRTAWVYGNHGKNFLRSILHHAAERDRLTIVDDQHGAPTWARMLAQLTAAAIQVAGFRGWDPLSGIYHLSAGGQTTWCRFARRFVARAVESGLLDKAPEIVPIATSEFPTPAKRPGYSVLDNGKFERGFDLVVPHWKEQCDLCLNDFHNP